MISCLFRVNSILAFGGDIIDESIPMSNENGKKNERAFKKTGEATCHPQWLNANFVDRNLQCINKLSYLINFFEIMYNQICP